MSWIVFDDIFFVLKEGINPLTIYAQSDLLPSLEESAAQGTMRIILDTPFQLIPESQYDEKSRFTLLQAIFPYSGYSEQRIITDTWPANYCKCIYSLPAQFGKYLPLETWHWMSCLAAYAQPWFDRHHTGLFTVRVQDTIYNLVQVNKVLKEASKHRLPSPDDSTYFTLKLVEKYRAHQQAFKVWTNDPSAAHLRILKKFIPEVSLLQPAGPEIITEIIHTACGSLQAG